LPRIARGELVFCIGMSEPNAGSTRIASHTGDQDGDFFVIEGHKIWTTAAHEATTLPRRAYRSDGREAQGISEFILT